MEYPLRALAYLAKHPDTHWYELPAGKRYRNAEGQLLCRHCGIVMENGQDTLLPNVKPPGIVCIREEGWYYRPWRGDDTWSPVQN